MLGELAALLHDPAVILAAAVVLVAAIVRGFAGFGAGMIYVPVAAALFGPQVAAATILLYDLPATIPFAIRLLPKANMREVLPLVIGGAVLTPVGAFVLTHLDPVPIRWAVSIVILVAVALIAGGWRFRRRIGDAGTLAVGGVAGFLNGLAQVGGPPLILFWMGQSTARERMRANATLFFTLGTATSIATYLVIGLFTYEVVLMSIIFAPLYAAGLYVGSHLFGIASDTTYRRIAYTIVAFSGLLGLPAFDGLFG
jgi:uncharacterized membrane protein YfcA